MSLTDSAFVGGRDKKSRTFSKWLVLNYTDCMWMALCVCESVVVLWWMDYFLLVLFDVWQHVILCIFFLYPLLTQLSRLHLYVTKAESFSYRTVFIVHFTNYGYLNGCIQNIHADFDSKGTVWSKPVSLILATSAKRIAEPSNEKKYY